MKIPYTHNVTNIRKETISDTFISCRGIKVSGIVLEINSDISCYSIVFIRRDVLMFYNFVHAENKLFQAEKCRARLEAAFLKNSARSKGSGSKPDTK